jgi:hypothetical protein
MTDTILTPEVSTPEVSTPEVSTPEVNERPEVSTPEVSTPEVNERPDWLPAKFKNYEELGKSYLELEKQHSSIYGAPDEYKNDGEIQETPASIILKNMCKSSNYSNKVYNTLLKSLEKEQNLILETQAKNLEELKKDFGEERLNFIDNYFNNCGLDKDKTSILKKSISNSKQQLEAIESFIKLQTEKISNSQPVTNINVTPVDVDKELFEIYTSQEYRLYPNNFKDKLAKLAEIKRSQK